MARRWCWTTAHKVGPDVFVDRRLAFGDKVAAHVYCRLTNCLVDVISGYGFWATVYVDDGIVVELAPLCQLALETSLRVFNAAGQIISASKLEKDGPPSHVCEVLGIVLDTQRLVLTLTSRKRASLLSKVSAISACRNPSVASVHSLVGSLRWMADLVPMGRFFVRALERDMFVARSRHLMVVSLSQVARDDLAWWSMLLSAPLPPVRVVLPSDCSPVEVWTDACPRGFGGHWKDQHFRGVWTAAERSVSGITNNEFELAAVVMAAWLWGPEWSGRRVALGCDNMVSVSVFARSYAANPFASHLLRLLAAAQLRFRFALHIQHVPGVDNDKADWLSRWDRYQDTFRDTHPHSMRKLLGQSIRSLDGWTFSRQLQELQRESGGEERPLLASALGPSGVWHGASVSSLPGLYVLPPLSSR